MYIHLFAYNHTQINMCNNKKLISIYRYTMIIYLYINIHNYMHIILS